jgi:hypothetical protein
MNNKFNKFLFYANVFCVGWNLIDLLFFNGGVGTLAILMLNATGAYLLRDFA